MSARLRISLFLLAVAARALAAQAPRCADATITGDRVGVVHIGMSLDSVRRVCSIIRDTTEMDEGESVRVVYALVAGDTVHFGVVGESVDVIAIDRPSFTMRDSVRVGMPLARYLARAHPTILVGEGKVYLIDRRHCGNSFGLSGEAYARVQHLTAATLAHLPRSTVIDEILVTGSELSARYGDCG